jgi:hypothetical protein
MKNNNKKLCFNTTINQTYETYSSDEYDRHGIDSVMYRKSFKKITDKQFLDIYKQLYFYKKHEMIVHISNYY